MSEEREREGKGAKGRRRTPLLASLSQDDKQRALDDFSDEEDF